MSILPLVSWHGSWRGNPATDCCGPAGGHFMRTFALILSLLILVFASSVARAADEVSLFDGAGRATAYIAVNDELTIYMWSGKPVAYLKKDSDGGHHVYGFNGKHLGWFVKGAIWDHSGKASCAVKQVLRSAEFEPFKSFKEFKPFKSFAEFAPFRPFLSNSFGEIPCRFLLGEGSK